MPLTKSALSSSASSDARAHHWTERRRSDANSTSLPRCHRSLCVRPSASDARATRNVDAVHDRTASLRSAAATRASGAADTHLSSELLRIRSPNDVHRAMNGERIFLLSIVPLIVGILWAADPAHPHSFLVALAGAILFSPLVMLILRTLMWTAWGLHRIGARLRRRAEMRERPDVRPPFY